MMFRGVNYRCWYHFGCSGRNANINSQGIALGGMQSLYRHESCLGQIKLKPNQIGVLYKLNAKFPMTIPGSLSYERTGWGGGGVSDADM